MANSDRPQDWLCETPQTAILAYWTCTLANFVVKQSVCVELIIATRDFICEAGMKIHVQSNHSKQTFAITIKLFTLQASRQSVKKIEIFLRHYPSWITTIKWWFRQLQNKYNCCEYVLACHNACTQALPVRERNEHFS